jgi:hypothetical protein
MDMRNDTFLGTGCAGALRIALVSMVTPAH